MQKQEHFPNACFTFYLYIHLLEIYIHITAKWNILLQWQSYYRYQIAESQIFFFIHHMYLCEWERFRKGMKNYHITHWSKQVRAILCYYLFHLPPILKIHFPNTHLRVILTFSPFPQKTLSLSFLHHNFAWVSGLPYLNYILSSIQFPSCHYCNNTKSPV